MTVQHLGALTVGACVPLALSATAQATAGINAALPDLQARAAGLVQLAASLTLTPPSLAASLTAALDLVASLEAAVTLGLPGVDFQAAGVAELLLTLEAQIGALEASLSLIASIEATLGTAGIHLYSLSGEAASVGQEVSAALSSGLPSGGGSSLGVVGVLLLAGAGSPDAQTALRAAFKTS